MGRASLHGLFVDWTHILGRLMCLLFISICVGFYFQIFSNSMSSKRLIRDLSSDDDTDDDV